MWEYGFPFEVMCLTVLLLGCSIAFGGGIEEGLCSGLKYFCNIRKYFRVVVVIVVVIIAVEVMVVEGNLIKCVLLIVVVGLVW
jgi:hypothetical protein